MLPPVSKDKISTMASKYQSLFPVETLDLMARESGFIQRQRVLTADGFAKMCILGGETSGMKVSLPQMCTKGVTLGFKIGTSSLDERFTASSEHFMKSVFERVVHFNLSNEMDLKTLDGFSSVKVQDSTGWQLPAALKARFPGFGGGASKAGIKIDLCMDLKKGGCQIDIRGGSESDNTASMGTIPVGSLSLRDLGYFKIERFREIECAKAFFIARMKCSTNIYEAENAVQVIDFKAFTKKLKVNEVKERWVYIGLRERFKVRLIVQKLPTAVANERKKSLRASMKDKGKSLTQDRLFWCEFNVFFTNVDENKYPGQLVMNLYTIRWMIEIIFKIWKSVYQIHLINSSNEHRLMCQLYGKLIWILLHQKLFTWVKAYFWNEFHIDLSELKGFKILQELRATLQFAIISNDLLLFEKFIEQFLETVPRVGKKQARFRRKNQLLFPSETLVFSAYKPDNQ